MKSSTALIAGLVVSVVGCTPTVKQMYERFDDDIQYAPGFTLEQLQSGKFRFIGSRKQTDKKTLVNGNILYTYGNYWVQYGIDRSPCDVYLEVNPKTNVVVTAHSEGGGCYMPY